MRHIGLILLCSFRVFTQLTWTYFGEQWYFIGQSAFETYVLFYAMLCADKNVVIIPISYLFFLSLLNLITDVSAFSFGEIPQMIIALLLTFGLGIWKYRL